MMHTRKLLTGASCLMVAMSLACGDEYVPQDGAANNAANNSVNNATNNSANNATNNASSFAQDVEEIVRIANAHRATGYDCGGEQMAPAGPLVMDAKLQRAAELHAQDMAAHDYFSHTSQDGRDFSTRSRDAGYTASPRGENIAAGNATAEATMQQWMGSPGHCKNIMSAETNEIGVGHAEGGSYGHYWVQKFGRR